MKKKRNRSLVLATLDLFTTIIIISLSLFVIALARFNDPTNHKVITELDERAAIVVVIDWPDGSDDDVDLWAQNPNGVFCSFRALDAGWMNLSRDMRGKTSDKQTVNGKVETNGVNRETLTIRKIIPGEYIFNIHMYAKRDTTETPVRVRVIRIFGAEQVVVVDKIIILKMRGQEETAIRVVFDNEGNIKDKNDLQKRFVN